MSGLHRTTRPAQGHHDDNHKPEKIFAPIPLRAIGDQRLTALELRALAVVAWHCRGTGKCWAKLQTMAAMIGCNHTSLSTAIRRLVEFGYLVRERSRGKDKRRFIFTIINDENKFACRQTSFETSLPTGKLHSRPNWQNCFDHQPVSGDDDAPNILYEIYMNRDDEIARDARAKKDNRLEKKQENKKQNYQQQAFQLARELDQERGEGSRHQKLVGKALHRRIDARTIVETIQRYRHECGFDLAYELAGQPEAVS